MQNNTDNNNINLPALMVAPDFSTEAERTEYESMLAFNEGDASNGFEATDFTPRLRILQNTSKELVPTNERYIPGAKVGQILNGGTRETFDVLGLIPCGFDKFYQEIDYSGDSPKYLGRLDYDWDSYFALPQNPDMKSARLLDNGNSCVETAILSFIAVTPEGEASEVEIRMTSTQLQTARDFKKLVGRQKIRLQNGRLAKAQSYAFAYTATTKLNDTKKGSYYSWHFSNPVQVVMPYLAMARDYADACALNAIADAEVLSVSDNGGVAANIESGIAAMTAGKSDKDGLPF